MARSPFLLPLLLLAACGTDDGRVDADGGGMDAGDGSVDAGDGGVDCTPIDPRFTVLFEQIFNTVTCNPNTICHGNPPEGDLQFKTDKTSARINLLDPTFHSRGRTEYARRVEPGAPDRSYILFRLTTNADPINEPQMPLVGEPLDPCQLEAIRTWIENGALDD